MGSHTESRRPGAEVTVIEPTPWWIPFLSALGGGAVGGTSALLAGKLSQDREDQRRKRSQQDSINATKADRLRELYAPLASAAMVLNAVMRSKSFVLEGDTIEERDERHDAQIKSAFEACQKVAGQIAIEPGAVAVNNACNDLSEEFGEYFRMLRMQEDQPGTYTVKSIRQTEAQLEAGMLNVLARAREQLTELEKPTD